MKWCCIYQKEHLSTTLNGSHEDRLVITWKMTCFVLHLLSQLFSPTTILHGDIVSQSFCEIKNYISSVFVLTLGRRHLDILVLAEKHKTPSACLELHRAATHAGRSGQSHVLYWWYNRESARKQRERVGDVTARSKHRVDREDYDWGTALNREANKQRTLII